MSGPARAILKPSLVSASAETRLIANRLVALLPAGAAGAHHHHGAVLIGAHHPGQLARRGHRQVLQFQRPGFLGAAAAMQVALELAGFPQRVVLQLLELVQAGAGLVAAFVVHAGIVAAIAAEGIFQLRFRRAVADLDGLGQIRAGDVLGQGRGGDKQQGEDKAFHADTPSEQAASLGGDGGNHPDNGQVPLSKPGRPPHTVGMPWEESVR